MSKHYTILLYKAKILSFFVQILLGRFISQRQSWETQNSWINTKDFIKFSPLYNLYYSTDTRFVQFSLSLYITLCRKKGFFHFLRKNRRQSEISAQH